MRMQTRTLEKAIFLFSIFGHMPAQHAFTEQKNAPPYLDPSLRIDERVNDLVSRTTLDEKRGQMHSNAGEVRCSRRTHTAGVSAFRRRASLRSRMKMQTTGQSRRRGESCERQYRLVVCRDPRARF